MKPDARGKVAVIDKSGERREMNYVDAIEQVKAGSVRFEDTPEPAPAPEPPVSGGPENPGNEGE